MFDNTQYMINGNDTIAHLEMATAPDTRHREDDDDQEYNTQQDAGKVG